MPHICKLVLLSTYSIFRAWFYLVLFVSSPLSPSLPQLRSASTYPPHRARCSHRTDPVPPMPLYAQLLPRVRCSHRAGPVSVPHGSGPARVRYCSTAFHTAPPVSLTHSPRATTSVPTTPPASTHPLLGPRPTCPYLRLHPPPSPPPFSLALPSCSSVFDPGGVVTQPPLRSRGLRHRRRRRRRRRPRRAAAVRAVRAAVQVAGRGRIKCRLATWTRPQRRVATTWRMDTRSDKRCPLVPLLLPRRLPLRFPFPLRDAAMAVAPGGQERAAASLRRRCTRSKASFLALPTGGIRRHTCRAMGWMNPRR